MTDLNLLHAERIRIDENLNFNAERLRDRIAADPSILGLGNLSSVDEGRLANDRLELLLRNPSSGERFTILIRVGEAQDGDLVRSLEQWTIERGRYPEHEHFAVVIAEQFSPQFLVAACGLGESIPLSLMQFAVLQVGERVVLNFIPVLDRIAGSRRFSTSGSSNGHTKIQRPNSGRINGDAQLHPVAPGLPAAAPEVQIAYMPRRRVRRNGGFFSFICVLSLLLSLIVAAAWIRSYSVRDAYTFSSATSHDHVVYSDCGSVEWILPANTLDGRERYVKIPYWLPIGMTLILPIAWLVRGHGRFENA